MVQCGRGGMINGNLRCFSGLCFMINKLSMCHRKGHDKILDIQSNVEPENMLRVNKYMRDCNRWKKKFQHSIKIITNRQNKKVVLQ